MAFASNMTPGTVGRTRVDTKAIVIHNWYDGPVEFYGIIANEDCPGLNDMVWGFWLYDEETENVGEERMFSIWRRDPDHPENLIEWDILKESEIDWSDATF